MATIFSVIKLSTSYKIYLYVVNGKRNIHLFSTHVFKITLRKIAAIAESLLEYFICTDADESCLLKCLRTRKSSKCLGLSLYLSLGYFNVVYAFLVSCSEGMFLLARCSRKWEMFERFYLYRHWK